MSRPLRIEFPGAAYHVTARGNLREPIYPDDSHRLLQLDILAHAIDRIGAQALAYCQIGNQFNLMLHTPRPILSRLMRHLDSVYSQTFNWRHGLAGQLFQGRFKAILVGRDAYLTMLCRHVERNGVAAWLVAAADDCRWSTCHAHLGQVASPPWLETDGLHAHVLGRAFETAYDRKRAIWLCASLIGQDSAEHSSYRQSHQPLTHSCRSGTKHDAPHRARRARHSREKNSREKSLCSRTVFHHSPSGPL